MKNISSIGFDELYQTWPPLNLPFFCGFKFSTAFSSFVENMKV